MGNTGTLQSMFERVCAGDVDGFVNFLSDDFVEHESGPGFEPPKAGTKKLFTMLLASFPDLRFDPEDVLETGDKVAVRVRITGTNKSDFMGIPASGKKMTSRASTLFDLAITVSRWSIGV